MMPQRLRDATLSNEGVGAIIITKINFSHYMRDYHMYPMP